MANVVVGVLESLAQAQSAVEELIRIGVPRSSIAFSASESNDASLPSGIARLTLDAAAAAVKTGIHVAATAGGLVASLVKLGLPDEQAHSYGEAVRRGGVVITIDADAPSAQRAADVLKRHGAFDVQESVYQRLYTGPERRTNSIPWHAAERRRAV